MPLPLLLRSKYDKISKEEIAKSIEDDQRDYSELDEFEKQERTLDQLGSDSGSDKDFQPPTSKGQIILKCHCFNQKTPNYVK